MAKDKKGFILYADQKELFEQLPNEKAGELIKHIFKYVNDEDPITDDILISLAFTPIKQQLKRDLVKFENKIIKKSTSGREGNLKRWNIDIYNDYMSKKITLEEAENIAKHRKTSHTDKVRSQSVANIADTVKVTDTVNVNDINNVNSVSKSKIDFNLLIQYFNKCTGKKTRIVNKKAKKQILERVKDGYTKNEIAKAILNASKSKHHIDSNYRHLTLELISRPEKFDMFLTMEDSKPKKIIGLG